MKWYQFRHFAQAPGIPKYICRRYLRTANRKPTYFFKVDHNQLFINYPCPFTIRNNKLYLHSVNKVDIIEGNTLTNWTEQSTSREGESFDTSLMKHQIWYIAHKVLSKAIWMWPTPSYTSCVVMFYCNIILAPILGFPICLSHRRSRQNVSLLFLSPLLATSPGHLILIDLMILIIFKKF